LRLLNFNVVVDGNCFQKYYDELYQHAASLYLMPSATSAATMTCPSPVAIASGPPTPTSRHMQQAHVTVNPGAGGTSTVLGGVPAVYTSTSDAWMTGQVAPPYSYHHPQQQQSYGHPSAHENHPSTAATSESWYPTFCCPVAGSASVDAAPTATSVKAQSTWSQQVHAGSSNNVFMMMHASAVYEDQHQSQQQQFYLMNPGNLNITAAGPTAFSPVAALGYYPSPYPRGNMINSASYQASVSYNRGPGSTRVSPYDRNTMRLPAMVASMMTNNPNPNHSGMTTPNNLTPPPNPQYSSHLGQQPQQQPSYAVAGNIHYHHVHGHHQVPPPQLQHSNLAAAYHHHLSISQMVPPPPSASFMLFNL
jgi:hypothetical protein